MSPEPSASHSSWIRTLGWAGLCLSLVTAIAGGVWSAVAEPEHVWSEQQAREFKAATEALHQSLGSDHSHASGPDHTHGPADSAEESRRAAEARLAAIQSELEAARYAKNRAGLLLVQLGVGGAACCGALLLFTSER